MGSTLNARKALRLERSCGPGPGDWMRLAPSAPGIERIEASFAGHGFDPHRHDTYAIGITLHGVQAFRYRGAARRCQPGQAFVLHPDELHDGSAGTSDGFRYRGVYIDPRLIHEALRDARSPLPFARNAVSTERRLLSGLLPVLEDLDTPLDDLQRDQLLADLADALNATDPAVERRIGKPHAWRAVQIARELLEAEPDSVVTSAALERATGISRYTLARQFRERLGTSPYRYRLLRRLDHARSLMRGGTALADVAQRCGFADQSHFTRHFLRAYGMPPGRWARLVGQAPSSGQA